MDGKIGLVYGPDLLSTMIHPQSGGAEIALIDMVKPSAQERRRLQNRMAQRKLRQNKAMQKGQLRHKQGDSSLIAHSPMSNTDGTDIYNWGHDEAPLCQKPQRETVPTSPEPCILPWSDLDQSQLVSGLHESNSPLKNDPHTDSLSNQHMLSMCSMMGTPEIELSPHNSPWTDILETGFSGRSAREGRQFPGDTTSDVRLWGNPSHIQSSAIQDTSRLSTQYVSSMIGLSTPRSMDDRDADNRVDEDQLSVSACSQKTKGSSISDGGRCKPQPLMHAAVMSGNPKVVATLLKHKAASVDERDEMGRSALHVAAANGHKAIVSLLLQSGGDPTVVDMAGQSPLYSAVANGHDEVVELILTHSRLLRDAGDG